MSDIIEVPRALNAGRQRMVYFRGHIMTPSRAARIKQYEPALRKIIGEVESPTEVARRLGFSVVAVREWAGILRIPLPHKKPRNRPHVTTGWWEVVDAGLKSGKTLDEIGAKLGVDVMSVHRFCKRHNISWRRQKYFARIKQK